VTMVQVTVLRRYGRKRWQVHRDGSLKHDLVTVCPPYEPSEGVLAAMYLGSGPGVLVCSWAAWMSVRPAKARSGLG
jgi:hypothetical protein